MIQEQLVKNWPALVAGGAVVATFWRQLQQCLVSLRSLLIVEIVLVGNHSCALRSYLVQSGCQGLGGSREVELDLLQDESLGRLALFGWYAPPWGQARVFFRKGRPFWAMASHRKLTENYGHNILTLSSFRGVVDLEELVGELLARFNAQVGRRFRVEKRVGTTLRNHAGAFGSPVSDIVTPSPDSVFLGGIKPGTRSRGSTFYVDSEETAVARQELAQWLSSREWYAQRGVPWEYGWFLYGLPGTGKTELAISSASRVNIPVFVFELASMDDQQFIEFWEEALSASPCQVLLEDLDSVFHGRENVVGVPGRRVSFGCLLNSLGGAQGSHGVHIVITANDATKVDPALVRSGRTDRHIHVRGLTGARQRELVTHILQDWPEEVERVMDGLELVEEITPAELTARCAAIARGLHLEQPKV